jgi:hypothetical protein
MTTHFFSPLSFIAIFGSGMGKNQDPGSGLNIPDPHHWFVCSPPVGMPQVRLKRMTPFHFLKARLALPFPDQ